MSQVDYYSHGGGYLQGTSPFSQAGTPSTRREISHSLRPLTCAQALKTSQAHTDADWTLEDMEIGQVTLVGQIVSLQTQNTNYIYWIDDGTGRFEARHWVDTTDAEDKWGGIEEGMYVRVTGGLKMFGQKRYINATHIRPVQDFHEIYFHILEVITVSLILERGHPHGPKKVAPLPGAGASAYLNQNTSAASDEFASLPPLQRAIVRFILDQPPSDEGVHVAAIARAIGTDGDAHKISDALDKLMDEGHVFSTIDDSHFNVSR
ncbi:replication protein A subunit RPA32 [Cyathus striatus]|nr:replication protein A subunit RPA32 [Cyathus striatus]